MTPLSVYLPFNLDCLRGEFVPAKRVAKAPPPNGHWLLVRGQSLIVIPDGDGFSLPAGDLPTALDSALKYRLWLGTFRGRPCWAAGLPPDVAVVS